MGIKLKHPRKITRCIIAYIIGTMLTGIIYAITPDQIITYAFYLKNKDALVFNFINDKDSHILIEKKEFKSGPATLSNTIMHKSSKALISVGIGIVVNAIVIIGIFAVPCITPPPSQTSNQTSTSPTPAFGSLTECSQIRTAGFIILGLADAFAVALVASELAKHSRDWQNTEFQR